MANDSDSALKIILDFLVQNQEKAEAAKKLVQQTGETTADTAKATDKLAESTKKATEKTGEIEGAHRGLHQILHLIGHESGPEAEAALAGIAGLAEGAGGFLLLVTAVHALAEAFDDAAKRAAELRTKAREALADLNDQASDAVEKIYALKSGFKEFQDGLDQKNAETGGKNALDLRIQQFRDLAAAVTDAGLASKQVANDWADFNINAAKTQVAGQAGANLAALQQQLDALKARQTGDDAVTRTIDLSRLMAQLDKLQEAYRSGTAFDPGRLPGNIIPRMVDSSFDDQDNGKTRKQQYDNAYNEIEREIRLRAVANDELETHIKQVEAAISHFNEVQQSLTNEVARDQDKGNSENATTAYGIALRIARGQDTSVQQQQFLSIFEKAVTGYSLTFQQAANLLLRQSANQETWFTLLERHEAQLALYKARLDTLEKHGQ